jgi:penicillin-binding protein 1A
MDDRSGPADEPSERGQPTTGAALRNLARAIGRDAARHSGAVRKRLSTFRGRGTATAPDEEPATRPVNAPLGVKAERTHPVGMMGRLGPLSRLQAVVLAAVLIAMIGFTVLMAWALHDVPWRQIAAGTLEPVVVLETADGRPLVNQGAYRGAYTRLEDFPSHLVDAVTTVEDRRFFEHFGLDMRGILRATWRNLSAGGVVEGGSTITQQLVKVSFLERHRTFKRKIQEAVLALWLDWRLGKEEILARYLNAIYLGAGATGVPAAARIYFNKDVGELTVAESAMLAGIIRAPSQLNPLADADAARERSRLVLDLMAETGKLEGEALAAARADQAELDPSTPQSRSGSWFADWVMPEGREIAGAFGGTVRLRTTLVPHLQQAAEEAVRATLAEEGEAHGAGQAALVAMTPDGAVVAMVGGRDYTQSAFNRATEAKRQPGSTFKLFVYHAALKAGIPMRATVVDEPVEFDGWAPANSGERYFGRVTLAEAFARSLNASTAKLAMEVGIDAVAGSARELGIDAPLTETPSLALGTSEVTLLDLTAAYASVRAGAAPVEPFGATRFAVDGGDSFAIPARRPTGELGPDQHELIDLLVLAMERGTGRQARLGRFAGGKTGTSQDYRDAWFVGFTEDYVAGVWVGNDDNSPMRQVTGGSLPARIWKRFMVAAAEAPKEPDPVADGVDAPAATAGVACNIRACGRAYRSFRPSDCTFQPYSGPRRLCEK